MRRFKGRIAMTLAAAGVTTALLWGGGDPPEATHAKHLQGRLWVDRMPSGDRDMVAKLVLVKSIDHGPYGVAERGSVWRHRTEVFKWRQDGTKVSVYLPQSRKRARFEVKTWRCKGKAPEPFELCLEISRNGKTKRLYSRRDWELTPRPGPGILGGDLLGVERGDFDEALFDEAPEAEPGVLVPLE